MVVTWAAEPLAAISMLEGWMPVHAVNSKRGRYTRLSSAAPVVSLPAVARWTVRPWKLRSKGWPLGLTTAAARDPTRACPGALGQAETLHQESRGRTLSKLVPAATTGEPSLVLATT